MGRRQSIWGAALLGVAAVIEAVLRTDTGPATAQYVVFAGLLALVTTVPLALPSATAAAVTVTAASAVSLSVTHALTVAGAAAVLICAYGLGRHGSPPVAALAGLPFLAVTLIQPEVYPRVVAILLAALAPAAALAGISRRISTTAAENSATRQALAGTLHEHTARGERARIARELHDVVAHHVSMIAVQAETARLTTAGMPPAGAQRLSAIGDTARAALTEMRRLLGVLRDDADATVPERQPQPGILQLTDLLDEARDASGTGTRLILTGSPTMLDPGVELAAYRIVQEALTNARRHAPGAAVDVELHYTSSALDLVIRDNGPGPGTRHGGHGLLGMSERAAAVGGTLETGPRASAVSWSGPPCRCRSRSGDQDRRGR